LKWEVSPVNELSAGLFKFDFSGERDGRKSVVNLLRKFLDVKY
jgi:hypothetical protein